MTDRPAGEAHEPAPGAPGFDAALAAFAGSAPLTFEGVRFTLRAVSIDHLECAVTSRWSWDDVNEERVRAELDRGHASLAALRRASSEFVRLTEGLPVSVVLLDDERRYYVAIDTEHGIKWV